MSLTLTAIAPMLTEIFKLINLMIEGKPAEVREAEAIIWFDIFWTPFKPLFPADSQAAITALIEKAKERAQAK